VLDDVLEHLNTLNEYTPKIRCTDKSVDPALIFGIDSKLFRDGDALPLSEPPPATAVKPHHDEVETVTLLRGSPMPAHVHVHNANSCDQPHHSHPHPEESTTTHAPEPAPLPLLDEPTLSAALQKLPKDSVYRVKGFISFTFTGTGTGTPSQMTGADTDTRTGTGAAADTADPEGKTRPRQWWILNWAFGRWELVPATTSPFAAVAGGEDEEENEERRGGVRLTVMGERGEVRRNAKRLAEALGAAVIV
jgi:G3E family GTPase